MKLNRVMCYPEINKIKYKLDVFDWTITNSTLSKHINYKPACATTIFHCLRWFLLCVLFLSACPKTSAFCLLKRVLPMCFLAPISYSRNPFVAWVCQSGCPRLLHLADLRKLQSCSITALSLKSKRAILPLMAFLILLRFVAKFFSWGSEIIFLMISNGDIFKSS